MRKYIDYCFDEDRNKIWLSWMDYDRGIAMSCGIDKHIDVSKAVDQILNNIIDF